MIAAVVVGGLVVVLLVLRAWVGRDGRAERMSEAWLDEHAGSRDK